MGRHETEIDATAGAGSTPARRTTRKPPYPFAAIVGQAEMKQALMIAAVDQKIGGVLVFGDRGTGKSTAVRALADLLPEIEVVADCPYNSDPDLPAQALGQTPQPEAKGRRLVPTPVVELPLGVTEDRVLGALDLERALTNGEKAFSPGLLARAHRGFLYIDEINLLEDHIVDLLLDVAASGVNVVEREGLSVRHDSSFVLVGSGNPEEGDLRPQLLDRFGLSVEVKTPIDPPTRIEVIKRRNAYEQDPHAFSESYHSGNAAVRDQVLQARRRLPDVVLPDPVMLKAVEICIRLGSDGLRGELTLVRAATVLAALEGLDTVTVEHLKQVAPSALRHRLRRDPLDEAGSTTRVERALSDIFED